MIIVAGVHARTGSTLVQRLLSCDPECMIWGEPPMGGPPYADGTRDYCPYVDPDANHPLRGHFWYRWLSPPPPQLKMVDFFEDILPQKKHSLCAIQHQLPCRDVDLEVIGNVAMLGFGTAIDVDPVPIIQRLYEQYVDTPRWGFKVVIWEWTEPLYRALLRRWRDLQVVFVWRDFKDTMRSWIRKSDLLHGLKSVEESYRAFKHNVAFAERHGFPILRFDSLFDDTMEVARHLRLNLSQDRAIEASRVRVNSTPPEARLTDKQLGLI